MRRIYFMGLLRIMDRVTMAKTIFFMDSRMPPSQTQMIIDLQRDMSFWQQKELLHGNPRNKKLLHCLQLNPNTSHSQKQEGKPSGSGIYTTNLAFHKWDQQSSKATMKAQ